MRIYVPTTLPGLAAYVRNDAVPSTAERFTAEDDTEESEYEALSEATDAATSLLDEPGRRVVIVADVDDEDAAFPLSQVEAVHADTDEVDPAEEDLPDLGWFGAQEIDELLA